MFGGRIAGFRGRPWSRKSPAAIMRHTRITTDAWLSTLDKPRSTSMFKETLGCLGGFATVGVLFGVLIFIASVMTS